MDDQDLPLSTAASPALHPQVFLAIEGVDDTNRRLLDPPMAAFSEAVSALTDIANLRDFLKADPALSDDERALQTANFSDARIEKAHKKMDAADKLLTSQIAYTEGELRRPLEAVVHTQSANEIRAIVRAMPQAERRKLLTDSIQTNDVTIVSAMLAVHPIQSGLTPVEREMLTRRWREKAAPQLAAQLSVLRKAHEYIGDRGGLVMQGAEALIGVSRTKLSELRVKAAAKKALLSKAA